MTRIVDRLALLISILTILAVYWVTTRVYEGVPHIEDEVAYSWQAAVNARGDIALTSPACPTCFLVPFVVDYQGLRFGKYPPGWPATLSLGVRLDARDWVNPLLAGLCVWLTYLLVKRFTSPLAGLLAAGLTLTSPFFLMNSGTLLSHTWSFFLTLSFILAWLDATSQPVRVSRWLTIPTAGLSLGLLALTRPLTALGVGIPFFIHGLIILFRRPFAVKRAVILIGLTSVVTGSLIFLWQYAVTGDPLLNPYTLWWPYDRIGFSPEVGVQEGGHNLDWARLNTRHSLRAGSSDLFGWGTLSWLFAPFGLIALRRKPLAWSVAAIAPVLILIYLLYWIGSWVYGPRYYFEGLISMTLLTAAGAAWLAGRLATPGVSSLRTWLARARFGVVTTLLAFLIAASAVIYIPIRVGGMHALYDASRSQLSPFLNPEAQSFAPALIIVHRQTNWREYTTLLELSSPYFDTPFVFSFNRSSERNQQVIDAFPDRAVWHYYPDTPYQFYTGPRP